MSEQTDIAYNHYDIIFRSMTAQFNGSENRLLIF
ncbi:hypothetical protein HNQ34_001317 [Anoxybacillus tepidamans]|uniref:Uncharacterized protein n=1 Tax=Anoxybacteroides tepidamans TaxID=265948 RepID=A0A7W8MUG7_9BACL|nr:hypothetical protein [Anoxybacillus tepidamans]